MRWAFCGLLAVSWTALADEPKDYKDVPPAELGIELVVAKKDPKTGFIVGGKNSTTLIQSLRELNGRPIADLEADMRPGALTEVGSTAGFLGKDESLLVVLAEDNSQVVDKLGLTHQALARPLRLLPAIERKRRTKPLTPSGPFTYHGRRFTVSLVFSRGFQLSPFQDGTKTNTEVELVNVDIGKKISYSLLVPEMIERYGFYEGKGTSYRVDPKQVIEVLDFLKPR